MIGWKWGQLEKRLFQSDIFFKHDYDWHTVSVSMTQSVSDTCLTRTGVHRIFSGILPSTLSNFPDEAKHLFNFFWLKITLFPE